MMINWFLIQARYSSDYLQNKNCALRLKTDSYHSPVMELVNGYNQTHHVNDVVLVGRWVSRGVKVWTHEVDLIVQSYFNYVF